MESTNGTHAFPLEQMAGSECMVRMECDARVSKQAAPSDGTLAKRKLVCNSQLTRPASVDAPKVGTVSRHGVLSTCNRIRRFYRSNKSFSVEWISPQSCSRFT